MDKPIMKRENLVTIADQRFLRLYDLAYAQGRHYYVASRRSADALVAYKSEDEAKSMLPDAVSCAVILCCPDREPVLLLSWEYRYPAGRCLLSVPAGLIDPADQAEADPLVVAAQRELKEETGLVMGEGDRIFAVNPFLYSTPGMTDESNALMCMVLHPADLSGLTQSGAEGTEFFDGFELVDRTQAAELLRTGRDRFGNFYSIFTWAALMYFVSGMWDEQ